MLHQISQNSKTTIIFESPRRIIKLLEELELFCGKRREIHIARELTKRYEEHIVTTIGDSKNYFTNKKILGEFTIVIKGLDIPTSENLDHYSLKKDLKRHNRTYLTDQIPQKQHQNLIEFSYHSEEYN